MERLTHRLEISRKALNTLFDALRQPKTDLVRDACIQRFEYSYETVWKAAQAYLSSIEKLDAGSPASVARACHRTGLLSETESRAVLRMATDRNLTVHTYNEELADEIYSRLPEYATLMDGWLRAIERMWNASRPG